MRAQAGPAHALADRPDDDEPQHPTVLTFALGDQICAVDVVHVREILDMTRISPLPNAPHDVLGMIDLRGQCISVVDLAGRIGVRRDPGDAARIIVFELPGHGAMVSVAVPADKVLSVLELPPDRIEPLPDTLTGWRCDVASGMMRTAQGMAMILQMGDIFGGGLPGPFDFA